MPAALDQVFKAYDVRGVYPDQLDEELAERVGRAFVALTGAATLAIGQDMRPSSKPMADALAAGAMAQGADVLRVGLCSTDMLYYVSGALDVAGVMLTASHNPARYNGLKLCRAGRGAGGGGVGPGRHQADGRRGRAGHPRRPPRPRATGRRPAGTLRRPRQELRRPRPRCGRSRWSPTPATAWPATWSRPSSPACRSSWCRCTSSWTAASPTTRPTRSNPENLRELQARVVAEGADVGLAFDGDADRVFLVDELGAAVPSSLVGALVARLLCEREPGATVLYNLICSRVVPETIREAGGVPVRTRVGHSFIKGVMAETGAVFGCEHSGHYYFRDNYRADSGLIAALVALDALSRAGRPLSEVLAPYRRYAASGEINRRVRRPRPGHREPWPRATRRRRPTSPTG